MNESSPRKIKLKDWFEKAKQEISALDAELILIWASNNKFDRAKLALLINDDVELSGDVLVRADRALSLRKEGMPLAYITNSREFYGRDFFVNEKVLVSRPETETAIDLILKIVKNGGEGWQIFDIGTGSGCIAVTLKLELKKAEVTAVDLSKEALKVAEENALRLLGKDFGKTGFRFLKSDLLEKIEFSEDKKTLVVANLPYVSKNWDWVDEKALSFEPEIALFAENEGLELVYKIINQFSEKCKNGYLVLETDVSQQEKVLDYAKLHDLAPVKTEGYISVFKTC